MASMTYDEMRDELRKVVRGKRTEAQRKSYEFNDRRCQQACKLLYKWGFESDEHEIVFTDGKVFAHVALACNFSGIWIPQAWLVLSEESIAFYRGDFTPIKSKSTKSKGGQNSKKATSKASEEESGEFAGFSS